MRRYMRGVNVGGEADPEIAREVGMEPAELEEMFRQVAIGDYDERYVLPKRHGEATPAAFSGQDSCSIDFSPPPATISELGNGDAAPDFDLRDRLVTRRPDG
jgi:nitrate reductase beta subunit